MTQPLVHQNRLDPYAPGGEVVLIQRIEAKLFLHFSALSVALNEAALCALALERLASRCNKPV
jgi:hypothetical protein